MDQQPGRALLPEKQLSTAPLFIPWLSGGHEESASLSVCLCIYQLWEARLEEPASIPKRTAEAPLEEAEGDTSSQAGTLGETPGHHPRKQEALPNIGIQKPGGQNFFSLSPAQLSSTQPSPVIPGSASPGTTAQLPKPGLGAGTHAIFGFLGEFPMDIFIASEWLWQVSKTVLFLLPRSLPTPGTARAPTGIIGKCQQ